MENGKEVEVVREITFIAGANIHVDVKMEELESRVRDVLIKNRAIQEKSKHKLEEALNAFNKKHANDCATTRQEGEALAKAIRAMASALKEDLAALQKSERELGQFIQETERTTKDRAELYARMEAEIRRESEERREYLKEDREAQQKMDEEISKLLKQHTEISKRIQGILEEDIGRLEEEILQTKQAAAMVPFVGSMTAAEPAEAAAANAAKELARNGKPVYSTTNVPLVGTVVVNVFNCYMAYKLLASEMASKEALQAVAKLELQAQAVRTQIEAVRTKAAEEAAKREARRRRRKEDIKWYHGTDSSETVSRVGLNKAEFLARDPEEGEKGFFVTPTKVYAQATAVRKTVARNWFNKTLNTPVVLVADNAVIGRFLKPTSFTNQKGTPEEGEMYIPVEDFDKVPRNAFRRTP
jgi:chromosome segregation ATPase